MSWEEDYRQRFSCPCGEGEYEEVHYSNDWGSSRVERKMLCPNCKEKYVYDETVAIYQKDGNEERGWVLKSVLESEHKQRNEVEKRAKSLYFKLWEEKFVNLKNKRQLWKVLTLDGKYYPSIGTFYKHTKGLKREEILEYIDKSFYYDNLKRIFEVIGIKPDRKLLGLNEDDINRLRLDEGA